MAKKNILITLGFVLLTIACGKVVGDMSGGAGGLNQKQLQKAKDQYCSSNQVLQEVENGTNVFFGQLNYHSSIFAFIGKDGKDCVIDAPINESFSDGTWFSITPPNNCLKSGSIWSVTSQPSGSGQYYTMKMIDDPDQRIMNMHGGYGLSGSYVAQKVGLKVLACVNK